MGKPSNFIVCSLLGAAIGGAIGIGIAIAVGLYGRWTHPNDASAGSGAIIVMLTLPAGLLVGAIAGVFYADRARRN